MSDETKMVWYFVKGWSDYYTFADKAAAERLHDCFVKRQGCVCSDIDSGPWSPFQIKTGAELRGASP